MLKKSLEGDGEQFGYPPVNLEGTTDELGRCHNSQENIKKGDGVGDTWEHWREAQPLPLPDTYWISTRA